MKRAIVFTSTLFVMALVACTVKNEYIEVTRIVEVPRQAALPKIEEVEVTRLVEVEVPVEVEIEVPVEVTRIVEVAEAEVTRVVIVVEEVEVQVPIEVTRMVIVEVPVGGPGAGVEVVEPLLEPTEDTELLEAPQEVIDGLLVWYDFEEDFLTSKMVSDRSGNGRHAQVFGTVDRVNGISGDQAIFFTGDSYIVAQSNPLAGRRAATISLWFKTDHPEENYKLASAAWWNGGPASGWIIATHIPEFWSDDTNSLYYPGLTNVENNFSSGQWVHEIVIYDGQRIKEYTNGQLVNDWPATGAPIGQGQTMAVGAWPPFSAYNFVGSIDEFQLFGRALTAQEVQDIYNQR